MMRTWGWEKDPSRRIWTLWVQDDELKTSVVYAPYNHRAAPPIDTYARFIVDACNEREQRGAVTGPWGDDGPFCPFCGNLRGAHNTECQAAPLS